MSIETQLERSRRIAAAEKAKLAKRGDVVAVKVRSSSTAMHGPTTSLWTWHLGTAGHVTREGVVQSAIVMRQCDDGSLWREERKAYDRGSWWEPLTISGPMQQAARAAFDAAPGHEYQTQEQLRDMILSRAAQAGASH